MKLPITLATIGPDSNGRCLDHLAAAVRFIPERYIGGTYADACTYHRERMSEADRLAFDCFLVRMRDPLAAEPGTPAHRFALRVQRMAELSGRYRPAPYGAYQGKPMPSDPQDPAETSLAYREAHASANDDIPAADRPEDYA